MDQELQIRASRNLRLDLSRMPRCCSVLLIVLQCRTENWGHTQFTRNTSPIQMHLIIFSIFKLLSVPPTPSYQIIFTKTGACYEAVGFCVIADTCIHFLLPVRKHSAHKRLLLEHILEVATVLLLAPIYDLIHSKPVLECQLICQYEFKSTGPFECLSFLFPCSCIILSHSGKLLNISLLRRLQSLYTK